MGFRITLDNANQVVVQDRCIPVTYVGSGKSNKWWQLLEAIDVKLSNGQDITIPAGFYTDMSSVPKWLWSFLPPFGDFLLAAIIHDYLYVARPYNINRAFADKEMLIWSNVLNENKIDNYIRYYAVRALGWTVWQKIFKIER